jgi:hypothetical protein
VLAALSRADVEVAVRDQPEGASLAIRGVTAADLTLRLAAPPTGRRSPTATPAGPPREVHHHLTVPTRGRNPPAVALPRTSEETEMADEPRAELDRLRDRLLARAHLFDDPAAYEAGVREALELTVGGAGSEPASAATASTA